MRKSIIFLCLLGLLPVIACAQTLPKPAGQDRRVQVFDYSPNEVYMLCAKAGYASLIQLEAGEFIPDDGGLGMGIADSWNIAVKGNHIFFKPIKDHADTNLLLATNKRTYAFILTTNNKDCGNTYIARFIYPAQAMAKTNQKTLPNYLTPSHKLTDGREVYMDASYNKHYAYRGDSNLKPSNAWDNNRFTYLKYDHALPLPVVYRILPDNTELLVNSHIEGNTLVLHETGLLYRLRLGNLVGEVGNQNLRLPKFNTQGAGNLGSQRMDINETGDDNE